MRYFYTLILTSFLIQPALADYKYVFYTDEPDESLAEESVAYLRSTSPFNKFDLDITIERVTADSFSCSQDSQIARLPNCDNSSIARRASRAGYDQAIFISNTSIGGSGGSVPIIGTQQIQSNGIRNRTHPQVVIHEYLHTLGFGDEYAYHNSVEANRYCTPDVFSEYLNTALIRPITGGYSNDQLARSRHSSSIPWISRINSSTPIISGSALGTPSSFNAEIGLFPANTCMHATNGYKSWRPGTESNIMGGFYSPVGALSPLVEQALHSIGVERRDSSTVARRVPQINVPNKEALDEVRRVQIQRELNSRSLREVVAIPEAEENSSLLSVQLGPASELGPRTGVDVDDIIVQEQKTDTIRETRSNDEAQDVDTPQFSNDSELSAREFANATSSCQMHINDFFEHPSNQAQKEEYMKIQGKITLHRIAWTYLKQMQSSTQTVEDFIGELILKRDPILHREFINSETKTRNEKLSFAISEMKRVSQELVNDPSEQAYALQYSDVKMMNLLANAEELNGRGMRDGVMDFTSIIKNSLRNRLNKKNDNLSVITAEISMLTDKKNQFESSLLDYLRSVNCAEVANVSTCEVEPMTSKNLSDILQNSEGIIDFVYQDDFGRKEELKSIYQWQSYWLHVK